MKWEGRRKSENVRTSGSSGGGGAGFPVGKMGIGGIVFIILISLLTGQNPLDLMGNPSSAPSQKQSSEFVPRNEEEKQWVEFLSVVLADTEDVWHQLFKEEGMEYQEAYLNIYQDRINTACGVGQAGMGPFYCSGDKTVYIDVSFARQLRTTFDADGDFPFAYVLAHEIGHHVQNQLGDLEKVHSKRGAADYNNEMVKMELQADYYAGVYAHFAASQGYLDPGDVEEGMRAAAGVGDDRIQEMQGGRANPDTFQHGSSDQRQRWFLKGYEYGDFQHGNTFSIRDSRDL